MFHRPLSPGLLTVQPLPGTATRSRGAPPSDNRHGRPALSIGMSTHRSGHQPQSGSFFSVITGS